MNFAKIGFKLLIVALISALALLFTSCGKPGSPVGELPQSSSSSTEKGGTALTEKAPDFIKSQLRGMWFSYYEIGDMYKSKQGFAAAFDEALDKCQQ